MKDNERLYALVLTRTPGIGLIGARNLLQAVGNATDVVLQAQSLV